MPLNCSALHPDDVSGINARAASNSDRPPTSLLPPAGYALSATLARIIRVAAHRRDSPSRTPRNRKSTRILWKLPRVRAQSHATKRYSAVGGNDASGKDRTGPTSCCVRLCCSQSQLGHQPARTSDKMADRAELFDSKMVRRIDRY